MATIGLLAHPHRPAARALAEQAAQWLSERGHRALMLDAPGGSAPVDHDVPGSPAGDVDDLALAVSLGGDGTMLRTVDWACPRGIPVLGVNFGHLGYLTSVEPEGLWAALEAFLAGAHTIERRMTLGVAVRDGQGVVVLERTALNDVVLQRPGGGHTVRLAVSVNDVPFLTFAADALILATPTGSTAYNLSARGPIVSPRARVQIVTPVAPHLLFDRSLVLDANDQVCCRTVEDSAADVVVDGWPATVLEEGSTLTATLGEHDALIVTGGADRVFHDVLKHKFGLGDGT